MDRVERVGEFVSEPMQPERGTGDPSGMARGEPGVPRRFRWRGQTHQIVEILRSWKSSTASGGEMYLRRHWHEVATAGGFRLVIYCERQPKDLRGARRRWWVYTIEDRPPNAALAGGERDAIMRGMSEGSTAESEADLLRALRRGDEAGYRRLLAEQGPRLLAVARRFLREEADAQDALQDAFLNAFRGLATFQGDSRLSTWLHRIVVTTCLMRLRAKKRRPERSIDDLLPGFDAAGHRLAPEPAWRGDVVEGAASREMAALVRNKIDELPDSYRNVILLRDIEQLDTRQAAEALGIDEGAVKVRLHRARQALRKLLDPLVREASSR